MSASVIARGTFGKSPPNGIALGAIVCQPPCVFGQMRAAVPRQSRRRLAARVRDLDARHRAVRFHELRDARERLDVFVRPKARGSPA